jgi:uncharacterized membrane protein
MNFCPKCGAQLDANATFCGACGAQLGASQAQNPTPVATPVQNQYQYQAQPNANEADNMSRGYVWLSYMGLLALIPLFVGKDSPNCQYHAKQGLNLLIVYAIAITALSIFGGFLNLIHVPVFISFFISSLPTIAIHIIYIVFAIKGIIRSIHLDRYEIPIIKDIHIVK